MPIPFSPPGVQRLRRAARDLRLIDTTLNQVQALDLIAQRHGWPNWALLHRNVAATPPSSALRYRLAPAARGAAGVWCLELLLSGRRARALASRAPDLWFSLPALPPGWFLGPGPTATSTSADPYLHASWPLARGRLLNGRFLCFVSVGSAASVDQAAEQLRKFAAVVQRLARVALDALLAESAAEGGATLFFTQRDSDGVETVWEERHRDLSAAEEASELDGRRPSAILAPDGWWSFSKRLGWRPVPADA